MKNYFSLKSKSKSKRTELTSKCKIEKVRQIKDTKIMKNHIGHFLYQKEQINRNNEVPTLNYESNFDSEICLSNVFLDRKVDIIDSYELINNRKTEEVRKSCRKDIFGD